jgi:hypothetical protein
MTFSNASREEMIFMEGFYNECLTNYQEDQRKLESEISFD